jgi:hypothetical protein
MRKPSGKKLIKGKRAQQLMLESGLQDRLVIFRITNLGYGSSKPPHSNSINAFMEAGGR